MSASSVSARTLPPFVVTTLVAGLLALNWWLGLSALIGKSVTNDETVHVIGGYSYWRFNDYRLQPENGNLPQRWAALPLLALQPHLNPAEDKTMWSDSDVWRIAEKFFFASGNNSDYLLFSARAAMGCWSVAAGALIFFWARRLWGSTGGLLALAFFAVSPTVLAQGSLVTSDMCAAFWLLAAVGAWWRTSGEITWCNLGISAATVGLAFVAKFSCVLLLPMILLMIGWRVWAAKPVQQRLGRSALAVAITGRGRKTLVLFALFALHLVIACGVIWISFGVRYHAAGPGMPVLARYYAPWEGLIPEHGIWHYFFTISRGWHVLPDAYLQGFGYVKYAAESRGAFLLGEFSDTGWWWFFPYAFFAKSSLAELTATTALLIGAALVLRRWQRSSHLRAQLIGQLETLLPLLVLILVYGATSIIGNLNIGQRHILPMYLALFVVAGALVRLSGRAWTAAWFLLPLAGAVESTAVRPNYLAFFNRAVGGPSNGWRQLADSSLDWGQDLPALSNWVQQHRQPGEKVFVSYFGSGNPAYEGISGRELSPYFSYGRPRVWFELEPGIYCIGATMLQDVYSNWRGDWTAKHENIYRRLLPIMRRELAEKKRSPVMAEFGQGKSGPLWSLDRMRFARLCNYLRVKQPEAVINYTQFVFRLSREEVEILVDGTTTQLAELMERAIAHKAR